MKPDYSKIQVILPNLNKRFSGITSTVLQLIPYQKEAVGLVCVGYPLSDEIPHLGWWKLIRLTRRPSQSGGSYVFHARRNIEMLYGLVLKKIFRCRLYLIFTSTAQRQHSRWTRFLYRNMDLVLSTSERAASYVRCPVAKIIPHGVDTATYRPAPDRQAAWKGGGLPGEHGIGIFGRVRPQKGLREFVEALCQVLPRHPRYTAVIIGEVTPKFRPFVEELKAMVREKGLEDRFCWLGKLPFKEIPGWFRRMSLVVCASHNEGFGLTCLEAMASAVPVVATRAGAWESIVREGENGYLAECRDSRSLAGAMEKAIRSREHLEELGQQALQDVFQHYTVEREAEALVAVYRDCLKSRNTPSVPRAAISPAEA